MRTADADTQASPSRILWVLLRLLLSAAPWIVALRYVYLDGQVFRNDLIFIAGATAAAAPWIPLSVTRQPPVLRGLAITLVSLHLIFIGRLAIDLPSSYRKQEDLNARGSHAATPPPLPSANN